MIIFTLFLLMTNKLFQSAFSLCIGAIEPACGPAALGYDGLVGCGAPFIPASSVGGSFVVTSSSPIAPTGISVISENVYEGSLCAGGNLPLLGSVGVEGEFLTAGAGAVTYGCGDDVAVVAEESPIVTGIVAPVVAPQYARAPAYFAPVSSSYGLGCGGYGYGGIRYGFGGIGYGSGLYGNDGCGCGL